MRYTIILIILVSVAATQCSWEQSLADTGYQDLVEEPDGKKPDILPFFVTICYHVEPNSMLFETVESGYFEAASACLRQMSQDLASVDVNATFCFAWLYNDIVYQRNRDPETGKMINSPLDTGIETYQQITGDGHELAYHSHPPMTIVEGPVVYYARPNPDCTHFDTKNLHSWRGLGADYYMDFSPGVYEFDDPSDPWYGQFIWERTSESLFRIANYLGVDIRHTNGGQKPLLDLTNKYGSGINHPHCLKQIRSLMQTGFDLIAPETMAFFSMEYSPEGNLWSDSSTGCISYFGSSANVQIYNPNIDGGHIEKRADVHQGLTFMPVQKQPQGAWMSAGKRDPRYYDAEKLGGKGGGGVQWDDRTFYSQYSGKAGGPWADPEERFVFPSLADQFNGAMHRHMIETPGSVNSWGLIHHVVNVMWSDLSGLSDNWDRMILFIRDIADGVADGIINKPRPDLVQFVTMQKLSQIYGDISQAGKPQVSPGDVNADGQINSADAILVLQMVVGLVEPTESQKLAADMDGDGEIRANDAIIILRRIVGLAAPSRDTWSLDRKYLPLLMEIYSIMEENTDPDHPEMKRFLNNLISSTRANKTELFQNYPNPFNPDTWIPYQLREKSDATIRIYTSTGQLARTLRLGHKSAGLYISKEKAAHWDGKNEAGEEMANGIYFYSISADGFSAIRKMSVRK